MEHINSSTYEFRYLHRVIRVSNYYQRKALAFVVIILNPSSLGATSYYLSLSRSQKLAREAGALPSNTLEDVAPTELLVEIHTEKENDRRMLLLWSLVILPIPNREIKKHQVRGLHLLSRIAHWKCLEFNALRDSRIYTMEQSNS